MKKSDIKEWADYNDGDILFVSNVTSLLDHEVVELSLDLTLLFVCREGRFQLDRNEHTFTLQSHEAMVCFPNTSLTNFMISSGLKCCMIGFTYRALEDEFYVGKNLWRAITDYNDHPIIRLNDEEMEVLGHFNDIATLKMRKPMSRYASRMSRSLLQSVAYEIFDVIERSRSLYVDDANIKPGDQLFRHFIEILGKSNGTRRIVSDYADQLHVSPKYLSTLIKQSSGMTPLQLIHKHTINVIIRKLRYSDKSIKDIANELRFPTIASFGKFFKSQTGQSPRRYRQQLRKI